MSVARIAEFQQQQRHQISKLATNKAILDFTDGLNRDPKRNKIIINLVDYSKTPHVVLKHFINPDMAKVLALEILMSTFPKTFPKGYVEYKGNPRPNGPPEARVLTIKFETTAGDGAEKRYPYTIQLERGDGERLPTGAVKMVAKKEGAMISASVPDMKRIMVQLLDYIRCWEARNLFTGDRNTYDGIIPVPDGF
jgi:hypothetical protein